MDLAFILPELHSSIGMDGIGCMVLRRYQIHRYKFMRESEVLTSLSPFRYRELYSLLEFILRTGKGNGEVYQALAEAGVLMPFGFEPSEKINVITGLLVF